MAKTYAVTKDADGVISPSNAVAHAAQGSTPAHAADTGRTYVALVEGRVELHYVDDTGAVTQITSLGAPLGGGSAPAATTTGTAPTYVLTPDTELGVYAAGNRYQVTFHEGTAAASTINVSGLGAKSLKRYDFTGAKVDGEIYAGQITDIIYDGTDFVLLDPAPSASGGIPAVTTTGTAPDYVLTPAIALEAYEEGNRYQVTFHAATTAASTVNISGLGTKLLKQYDATGAKADPTLYVDQISDIVYDGTDFILLDPVSEPLTGGPSTITGATNVAMATIDTELVLGGFFLDPASYETEPAIVFEAQGLLSTTDAAGSLELRLYDMGPGTGAFVPVLRSVLTLSFANVDEMTILSQALTAVAVPGVDADEVHTTLRAYEVRAYLSASDAAVANVTWAGLTIGGDRSKDPGILTGATNESTQVQEIEQIIGGFIFNPADHFASPDVTLRAQVELNTADAAGYADVRLYDMGPGTGSFTPVLRATMTVTYANVDEAHILSQALSLVAAPGVDVGEVHNTMRAYELRVFLETSDAGTITVPWAGLSIVRGAEEPVVESGSGVTHDLIVDTGATPAGNVYDSLAAALTAANALNGIVRIQITQDLSISSGTYDFSNVALVATAPTKTITFSDTATTTGTPFIELTNVAISSLLAAPLYTLAADASLTLRGLSLLGSDAAALLELNGFSCELYMHDYSGFSSKPTGIGVINSDATGSVLYLLRTSAWAVLADAIAVTGAGDLELYYQRSGVDVTEYDLSTVFSTVDQSTIFTFEVTPLTLTPDELIADVDDYNPPGFEAASLVRLSSDASWDISGFYAGGGYLVPHKTLINIGANNIILNHQSIASDPVYRIITSDESDLTLAPGRAALLYRDYIAEKWRVFGLEASAVGGSGQTADFIYDVSTPSAGNSYDNFADLVAAANALGCRSTCYVKTVGADASLAVAAPHNVSLIDFVGVPTGSSAPVIAFNGATLEGTTMLHLRSVKFANSGVSPLITTDVGECQCFLKGKAGLRATGGPIFMADAQDLSLFIYDEGELEPDGSELIAASAPSTLVYITTSVPVTDWVGGSWTAMATPDCDLRIKDHSRRPISATSALDNALYPGSEYYGVPGVIEPAALAANVNDFAPDFHMCAKIIRITLTGSRTVTGFAAGYHGREITIINADTADSLTLSNQNVLSSGGNRFLSVTGSDVVLGPNEMAYGVYDETTQRWRIGKW